MFMASVIFVECRAWYSKDLDVLSKEWIGLHIAGVERDIQSEGTSHTLHN